MSTTRAPFAALSAGGTGQGADAAIILTPDASIRFLNTKVHEVLCKPGLFKWLNDASLRYLIGETRPTSMQDVQKSIDAKREDRVWFAIVRKQDDRIIGETGLLRMFPAWSTTDLSIIVTDEGCRGKGYGTEAITLMLTYAFGYMNFNRVAIGVVGFNEKALRFYEKIGFVKEGIEGIREEGYYCKFEYSDFVMMRILRREFMAKYQKQT